MICFHLIISTSTITKFQGFLFRFSFQVSSLQGIFEYLYQQMMYIIIYKFIQTKLQIDKLQQKMINYFLQQEDNISPGVKHFIRNDLSKPRKYQPFHIDCAITKKKICYCVNNPVLNVEMDPKVRQKVWEKYQQAEDFYLGVDPEDKIKAKQHIDNIKTKIQCLSRKEVVSFVKSIKKQKNLIGEMIEY